jgi:hypothetical protein
LRPIPPRGYRPFGRPIYWQFAGFGFDNNGSVITASFTPGAAQYTYAGYRLTLPMWFLFLLSLMVPSTRLVLHWRAHRRWFGARGFEVNQVPP